jgi:orotidine-5'-phosphate decarboxylase
MAELILALDVEDAQRATAVARRLKGLVGWCKVGLELFVGAGPHVLPSLKDMGYSVFLDLKFHDIPNTVGRAVRAASQWADMLTLHVQGGERMCVAAREAADAARKPPLLFGVSVLTSLGPGEMPGMDIDPGRFALSLARMAKRWGLDGVVCSGREVEDVRKACGEMACLCPGIRPAGAAAGDQRRAVTPAMAVAAGARYLVVGRPILQALDPCEAASAILAEMARAPAAQDGLQPG